MVYKPTFTSLGGPHHPHPVAPIQVFLDRRCFQDGDYPTLGIIYVELAIMFGRFW
jgi:hypothetical protein